MDFYTLLEHSQLLAISSAINPTVESIYRIKCREYSVQFNTPLHVVYDLDPCLVLQALFEDQYHPSIVEEELEELLEKLYKIQDPSYSKVSNEELEDLVDSVINFENKRKKNKNTQLKEDIQKTLLKKNTFEKVKKPTTPKSGGMSFENIDNDEENLTDFKD